MTLFYQVRRSLFLCFHGNPCDCCKRVSTIWYPLVLSQINSIDLISKLNFRKHGVRMTVLNRVVCQACLSYLTEKKTIVEKRRCVLIQKLILFYYKLPKQLQASWFYQHLLFSEKQLLLMLLET